MKLIVGLGNPGREYHGTRHNAGWLVLDRLAERWGWRVDQSRFSALIAEGWRKPGPSAEAAEERVLLLKPMTFMNRSGDAVGQAVRWHKADARQDVLVILDDVDLPLGRLRMRAGGGSGGHRGLENVLQVLGTPDFTRLRVGVGRPRHPEHPTADHVLSAPTGEEATTFREALDQAADAVEWWLKIGTELAMNKVNV